MMVEKIRSQDLVYLMKQISIELEIQIENCLRYQDLSGTQMYLLVYILRRHPDGTFITEMGRETGVSKATLSVLVKKLREKGYLRFQNQPGDIRKKKVVPTDKLLEARDLYMERARFLEEDICAGLDGTEKEMFFELETKMLRQLEQLEGKKEVTT